VRGESSAVWNHREVWVIPVSPSDEEHGQDEAKVEGLLFASEEKSLDLSA
jgi:hypothetical protein